MTFCLLCANSTSAVFLNEALAGRLQFIAAVLTLVALCLLQAAPFEGTFRADQGVVHLKLQKGAVRGIITLGSEKVVLSGKVTQGVLVGRAVDGFRKQFAFRATLVDGVLSLTINDDTIEFMRAKPERSAG